ncbi:MAG: CHASE domain-containing protein [Thermoplasmatota archaeon]
MARLPYPWQLLLASVSYYAVGWASLEAFAQIHASASPVWPPTGIAIAILLLGGRRLLPAIFVGAFLFNVVTSGHWQASLLIAVGNSAEAWLVAWIASKWIGRDLFTSAPKTLAFSLSVVPATAVSASVGVGALLLFDLAPSDLAVGIWQTWWLGDLAGALIFAPAVLLWRNRTQFSNAAPVLLASVGVAFLTFWVLPVAGLLLLVPLVAWAGNQKTPATMALMNVLLAVVAIAGTLTAGGAFSGPDANQNLVELQLFVAFFSGTAIILAASATERQFEAQTPAKHLRLRTMAVAVLALMPLGLGTAFAHGIVGPAYQSIELQEHERDLNQLTDTWVDTLEGHEAWLLAAKAMLETNPNVTRSMFHQYVDESGWRSDYGGLTAVGYNPYVAAGTESDLVSYWENDASLADLGYPPVPADISGEGFYVDYLVPIEDNEAAFGFNVLSEPTRQVAIEEAVRTGNLTATAPIVFVQETNEIPGLLLVMPVYNGLDPGTPELREAAIRGIVVGALRGADLAAFALRHNDHLQVDQFWVEDLGSGTDLYRQTPEASGEAELASNFEMAGRSYQLHLQPTHTHTGLLQWAPIFVIASGGVLSFAFVMAVYAYDSTRRRAHEQAGRMTQRLREAQKIAQVGSWEWDIKANRVDWSDQLYTIFGRKKEEFEATFEGYLAALHPEDRDEIKGIIQHSFETGESFGTDHRVQWPDGTIRWVHGQGEVVRGPDGTPIRMSGTAQDVTARREAEIARQEAVAQSQEITHLKKLDEFKTQFLNTAAHELRTPLSPIMLQLHVLLRSELADDPRYGQSLEVLDRNMKRLNELIDDFVSSAQFQAGKLAVNKEPGDLGAVIQEAVDSFQPQAEAQGITLEAHCACTEDLQFDKKRMSQVLYNLLSNAFKFTPEGGRITTACNVTEEGIKITVTDTGAGMAKEDIKKLFAPFVQVHDPMTITERGSGLGLYICKAIAEGHGGTIEASSPGPGKGTTFLVRIPH